MNSIRVKILAVQHRISHGTSIPGRDDVEIFLYGLVAAAPRQDLGKH